MKRLKQSGFGLVVVLALTIVVLGGGFVAWQVIKNDTSQPKANTPASGTQANNDCGSDRQCFYQAFSSDCTQKTIKTVQTTIEGDPITTTAKVSQGFEGCIVEVTVDGSQDKFGDGKVHTYTCEKLVQENQTLMAGECKGTSETSSVVI